MNYFKRLETIIIGVLILVLAVAYGALNDKTSNKATTPDQSSTQDTQVEQQQVPASTVSYRGQSQKDALTLLKSSHQVETQNFSGVGEFVKSIDGIEPDSNHFWAFYVNGLQATVGADSYVTKDSDFIEWRMEEIK